MVYNATGGKVCLDGMRRAKAPKIVDVHDDSRGVARSGSLCSSGEQRVGDGGVGPHGTLPARHDQRKNEKQANGRGKQNGSPEMQMKKAPPDAGRKAEAAILDVHQTQRA